MNQDLANACAETVTRVINETRGKPDLSIQKALTSAAPFHRNNLNGWKLYTAEIKKQTGRIMY